MYFQYRTSRNCVLEGDLTLRAGGGDKGVQLCGGQAPGGAKGSAAGKGTGDGSQRTSGKVRWKTRLSSQGNASANEHPAPPRPVPASQSAPAALTDGLATRSPDTHRGSPGGGPRVPPRQWSPDAGQPGQSAAHSPPAALACRTRTRRAQRDPRGPGRAAGRLRLCEHNSTQTVFPRHNGCPPLREGTRCLPLAPPQKQNRVKRPSGVGHGSPTLALEGRRAPATTRSLARASPPESRTKSTFKFRDTTLRNNSCSSSATFHFSLRQGADPESAVQLRSKRRGPAASIPMGSEEQEENNFSQ
ncbi:hypothetical protein H8959_009906 [Pygathrix nigripes]